MFGCKFDWRDWTGNVWGYDRLFYELCRVGLFFFFCFYTREAVVYHTKRRDSGRFHLHSMALRAG